MISDNFDTLRRLLDEAITYDDCIVARDLVTHALAVARDKEVVGEMMYFRAQAAIIEEDYIRAIKYLDRAIQFNPHDGAAYNDRALSMVELGMVDAAFPYFDKGIEAEPDYATVYHNKGWLLLKVGKPKDAIPFFERALSLEDDRAVTYENLGCAYAMLGKKHDALKAYVKAFDCIDKRHTSIRAQIKEKLTTLFREIQSIDSET